MTSPLDRNQQTPVLTPGLQAEITRRVAELGADPVIDPPDAFDHENYVGTCDWGYCDHASIAMRWSGTKGKYLAVCWGHSFPGRRHDSRCEVI